MADVGRLAKELAASKISTERVEVDDDSAPPTVAANSSEEKALLKELDGLLPEALKAVPDATKLMCLRGRKYDPARGAETLQALEDLKETLELSHPPPQLAADIASGKVTNPGGVDEMGRSVIWMRLRFNNPKESGPQDMGRLIAKVMLNALENVETQRNGVVLINDMSGIGVKNLSPSTVKYIMGEVLPALPIRVHRILLVRPPWFITRVIFPIVSTFLSKKLKSRIGLIPEVDGRVDKLFEYLPPASVPAEVGGTAAFDMEAWAASMLK